MGSMNTAVATAATVLALGRGLIGSAPARADHLTRATKHQSEVTIRGYARWNNNCEAEEPPQIHLDAAPQNGFVCVRPNNGIVQIVREGKANHCVGRRIPGVSLVYLPRGRFTGVDAIKYTVKFQTVNVTVDADITVGSERTIPDTGGASPSTGAP